MNDMIAKYIYNLILCLLIVTSAFGCKPPIKLKEHDKATVESKVKKWKIVSDEFISKNDILKPKVLHNYMTNSFNEINIEQKNFKSYKNTILNFVYKNYQDEISNKDFFVVEKISQHGITYMLYLNGKRKNLIELTAFRGSLILKRKEKTDFTQFRNFFDESPSFKKCKEINIRNQYTIINKFTDNGDIEIKVIDMQCSP